MQILNGLTSGKNKKADPSETTESGTVTKVKKGSTLVGQTLYLCGGAGRDRTDDLLNAIQALSQLSYNPILRG